MLGLPLAFAAPTVLIALVGLAALWWFLRVTPPRPRQERFPPLRLLLGLRERDLTPARTPLWLLALRLLIAGAIVLAMAGPIWNAVAARSGQGALLIVLDDGWASAPTWDKRLEAARDAMRSATRAGRLVALAPVSEGGAELTPLDAANFERRLRALAPAPYAPKREAAQAPIGRFLAADPKAEVLWIADGLESGGAGAFASALKGLAKGHDVTVAADAATPVAIDGIDSQPGALKVKLTRADANAPADGAVRAFDPQGRAIGDAPFHFNETAAEASFELPVELRNEIAKISVAGQNAAGSVWLVDERWKRRRVAVASGASADLAEPLLAATYYIKRALQPFAELREAPPGDADPIATLLAEKPSALVLADMTVPPGPIHDRIGEFVEGGGVLIRFAGTRLAAGDDDLTPTPLRRGGRTLGGALSWETPKHVAPFEAPSPFVGAPAPEEVTVTRQVLAEPGPGLQEKTWARLADGTPLVTAARRGKGLVVLFHVTADTTWSNLPISGLFVEMLRRIVAQAGAPPAAPDVNGAAKAKTTLPPWRTLDGYGELGIPPASALPIPDTFAASAEATHPPGFYGAAAAFTAINTLAPGETLARADYAGLPQRSGGLEVSPPLDLKPWLLALALLAFVADGLASLWIARPRRGFARAAALGIALVVAAGAFDLRPAAAQSLEADQKAALQTHLAYVVTGDAEVDETSRLGLANLEQVLNARTSAAVADPMALDPAKDELAFYPLIYWPIVAGRPQPPASAVAHIAAFMRNGGTVIFDTRDALTAIPGGPPTAEALWLRKLLAGVDVPELEPIPRDHVVTKTFYLVESIVGRTEMGQTWIEALPPPDPSDRSPRPARAGDSVSPIIVTSNDLAGAWAADDRGAPLHPLVPGGPRQREMALRGGVNLVMYALTGNYKADQVHAKDLLERLSH